MALMDLTEAEFRARLAAHQLWLQTAGTDSRSADGTQLSLADIHLPSLTLVNQDLSTAELVRCRSEDSTFRDCDFSYSTLISSDFRGCTFLRCKFVKADLRSVNCAGVDFTDSNLTRADLTEANLHGVNLTNCCLDWAWLIETDLRDAILTGAHFEGTRLIRTKVYNRRQFKIGSLARTVIQDLDPSPDASGAKVSGAEALQFLHPQ